MADLNFVVRRRSRRTEQFENTVPATRRVRVVGHATSRRGSAVMRPRHARALYKAPRHRNADGSFERFEKLVRSPYGMVVCAGPTGSGKTTTLYASLMEINREEINVTTIEDPVEYVFPEINQIQINEQAGITFAGGLRSILRQDPDAILVGEIRDVETARIAVQAALTGHLVLSSIHSTDAISALHRFFEMCIEEFLIASSMLGVVAQRLFGASAKLPARTSTPTRSSPTTSATTVPSDAFLHRRGRQTSAAAPATSNRSASTRSCT